MGSTAGTSPELGHIRLPLLPDHPPPRPPFPLQSYSPVTSDSPGRVDYREGGEGEWKKTDKMEKR